MIAKPAHGQPCNGCGLCCREELCVLGHHVFGVWSGPCPALGMHDGKMTCGLAENPRRHAPVRAAIRGQGVLREAALALIGAGVGCDAQHSDEPSNAVFIGHMAALRLTRRAEYQAAFDAWGVNRRATDKSYRQWLRRHGADGG